ncbi:MAG: hypothetical protein IPK39_13215 [Sulfuritalea sp.]|nr:hypothetical protein [Sulfuritalea sp.]
MAQAYVRRARRWCNCGGDPQQLRLGSQRILSRVDTLVDQRLDAPGVAPALKGKMGVALARCCYHRYLEIFTARPSPR